MAQEFIDSFISAGWVSLVVSSLLLIRSLSNYSRTGPEIRREVQESFFYYSIYALIRLVCWSSVISFYLALPGALFSVFWGLFFSQNNSLFTPVLMGLFSFALITGRQLLNFLLFNPGVIVTSANFDTSAVSPGWDDSPR